MAYIETKRGLVVFDAVTFEHYPFTRYSWGGPIGVSLTKIRELQKSNPKAYVHVLYDIKYTGMKPRGFIQVRNLVITE